MPSIAPDAPALSFLAERFSFSDMPGFLALGFFGDLSANAIVPCDRTQVHRSGGAGQALSWWVHATRAHNGSEPPADAGGSLHDVLDACGIR